MTSPTERHRELGNETTTPLVNPTEAYETLERQGKLILGLQTDWVPVPGDYHVITELCITPTSPPSNLNDLNKFADCLPKPDKSNLGHVHYSVLTLPKFLHRSNAGTVKRINAIELSGSQPLNLLESASGQRGQTNEHLIRITQDTKVTIYPNIESLQAYAEFVKNFYSGRPNFKLSHFNEGRPSFDTSRMRLRDIEQMDSFLPLNFWSQYDTLE